MAVFIPHNATEAEVVRGFVLNAKDYAKLTTKEANALKPFVKKVVRGDYDCQICGIDATRTPNDEFGHLRDSKRGEIALALLFNNWLRLAPKSCHAWNKHR